MDSSRRDSSSSKKGDTAGKGDAADDAVDATSTAAAPATSSNRTAILLNNRGVVAFSSGDVVQAMALFSKALRLLKSTEASPSTAETSRTESQSQLKPASAPVSTSTSAASAATTASSKTKIDAAATVAATNGDAPKKQNDMQRLTFGYDWVRCPSSCSQLLPRSMLPDIVPRNLLSSKARQSALKVAAATAASSAASSSTTAARGVKRQLNGRKSTDRATSRPASIVPPPLANKRRRISPTAAVQLVAAVNRSGTASQTTREGQPTSSSSPSPLSPPPPPPSRTAAPSHASAHTPTSAPAASANIARLPTESTQKPFLVIHAVKICAAVHHYKQPVRNAEEANTPELIASVNRMIDTSCPTTFDWAIRANFNLATALIAFRHYNDHGRTQTIGRFLLLCSAKRLNRMDASIRSDMTRLKNSMSRKEQMQRCMLMLMAVNTLSCICHELYYLKISAQVCKRMAKMVALARRHPLHDPRMLRPFIMNIKVWSQMNAASAA